MKKICSILLTFLLTTLICLGLVSCGEGNQGGTDKPENKAVSIRYLNFKPESAQIYSEISKAYEKETGVKVIVETAASNTYEQTLAAKMSTDEAPTLFQINGPKGYANWKDYCADLTDSKLYEHLKDKSLAIKVNDKVYGIPYVVEAYGIIYNKEITDKYFALDNRETDFKDMDEVNNYEKLSKLVTDMQKNKDALGIKAVFASTSLKSGEDWRWQTHLLNIPLAYEFEKNSTDLTTDQTAKIQFEYSNNFKNIFDLYLNNSVTDKKLSATKTVADSMAEFALGQCAMVQNGNWAWSQIAEVSGNKVSEENIKFMPIYTGIEGEEKQGLCVGTENFYAVNSKASKEQQQAAKDFIYWLYSSEKGKKFVTDELGFIAPFDTFGEDETPNDPLGKEVSNWMSKGDIKVIPWNFTIFPSQTFKEGFGSSLLKYAQGNKTWEDVKEDMIVSWESESATKE